MTGTTEHELSGLEPDNLLAFLALLGLLRALETAKPDWHPRVKWHGSPPSANLVIDREVTSDQLASETDIGVKQIGQWYAVLDGYDDIKFTSEEFRTLQRTCTNRIQSQIVCTLGSDGAIKKNGKQIAPTAFCAILGSGRQYFLKRLRSVPCDGTARDIHSALFETWQYLDNTRSSFRWDPIEDRRYALRFGNPSKNKIRTVTGANRLAAIGFGMLVSVPTTLGLATLGFVDKDKHKYVCWPVPNVPTTLAAYLALLAHPDLANPKESFKLYGISAIARAERFQVEKYFNFTRARMQFLS